MIINENAVSLTIGMPVYNAECFVARALGALIEQNFQDWKMLVADNCSTDGTVDVVKEFCRRDSRIKLVRHKVNIGAVNNFLFLVNQSHSPFFMWAAADDEWSPNYISACIAVLQANPDVGFASGAVVNTNLLGERLREYASFAQFEAIEPRSRLKHFVQSREADGKANMIYSVYRTPLVQAVCGIPDIFDGWGSDMAFVAAALARARYMQVHEATLLKRVVSESDMNTARMLAAKCYSKIQFEGHFPPTFYNSYVRALKRGMPTAELGALVHTCMLRRRLMLYLRRCLGLSA